jgi:ArsR family transcriptional regulator
MSSANHEHTLLAAVHALKGAADPTRLRLLALLAHGELTVGELCAVLRQSQPRISRHLRLLAESGYLDRFREQQHVYYRTPVAGLRFGWLRQLLELLGAQEPQLQRDRERMEQVIADRARQAARLLPASAAPMTDEDTATLAALVLEEVGPVGVGELLDIGTGSGQMLQHLARRAQHAVGIDIASPALRLARTRLHGAGLRHCEFHRGDMYQLPCATASFDTVTMDRVLAAAARPEAALHEAVRALRPDGRLIIVEGFEQIERAVGGNALRGLRRWLAGAGLRIERLRPCDAAGCHYLIATARPATVQGAEAA